MFKNRKLNRFIFVFLLILLLITFTCFFSSLFYVEMYNSHWYIKDRKPSYFEVFKNIKQKIDQDVIDEKFTNGSLPHILLSELLKEDPDGLSTQKAFEIINETKSKN